MKTTGKWIFLVILMLVLTTSCNSNKSKEKVSDDTKIAVIVKDSIGEKLFDQKCMLCHNHVGKTDSTMLAPPFFAVKRRYLKASIDKEDFLKNVTYWVNNPIEENIIMLGTTEQFEVMPYLAYTAEDIAIIVNYIYETNIPKPVWFDAHEESHEKEGRGQGNGQGRGQGK